jgi:hypothetical protein
MKKICVISFLFPLLLIACGVTHELEVTILAPDSSTMNLYYQPGNRYVFSIINKVSGSYVYDSQITGIEIGEKIIDEGIPTGDFLLPVLDVFSSTGQKLLTTSFLNGSTIDISVQNSYAPSFSIYGGDIVTVTLQLTSP